LLRHLAPLPHAIGDIDRRSPRLVDGVVERSLVARPFPPHRPERLPDGGPVEIGGRTLDRLLTLELLPEGVVDELLAIVLHRRGACEAAEEIADERRRDDDGPGRDHAVSIRESGTAEPDRAALNEGLWGSLRLREDSPQAPEDADRAALERFTDGPARKLSAE